MGLTPDQMKRMADTANSSNIGIKNDNLDILVRLRQIRLRCLGITEDVDVTNEEMKPDRVTGPDGKVVSVKAEILKVFPDLKVNIAVFYSYFVYNLPRAWGTRVSA